MENENLPGPVHIIGVKAEPGTLGTVLNDQKREIDGLYRAQRLLRAVSLLQFGFDLGGSKEVRIEYTGLICNDFELLGS
jgi:hypothetical protein